MSRTVSVRRRLAVHLMQAVMLVAVGLALTPLVWILVDVVKAGVHAIGGIAFFTQGPPADPAAREGGVANGIVGTLIMVGLATVVAVPLSLMGAIYLVEFGKQARLAQAVRFFADVMTGIPSIIFGIFAYAVLVVATRSFSALAGAVALALVMWPLVLRTCEEMLWLVPREVRDGALALGVPRWRMIVKVALPSAAAGITTSVMLAVARAAFVHRARQPVRLGAPGPSDLGAAAGDLPGRDHRLHRRQPARLGRRAHPGRPGPAADPWRPVAHQPAGMTRSPWAHTSKSKPSPPGTGPARRWRTSPWSWSPIPPTR